MGDPEVTFHNVATRYLPRTPVECHYSLTIHSAWNPKDWIGLFKVGWRSIRDYQTFVWSVPPQGQRARSPLNCCVRFEASYLPPPGPSVYQFSYVAGNGTLRGSSPHFTFSSPEPQDELVTLEGPDCNPDMVLVVTKSSLLETQLAESERNRGDLTRLQKETEMEVRELEGRIRKLEASAERWRSENSKLLGRCESLTEEEREARAECQLLRERLLNSTARIQDLEEKVKSISQTLLERESTLDRVRDRVKDMSTQQEELARQAQGDTEERQLFEAQVESLKREGRNLRTALADRDAELDSLKTEVQRLQHQISTASKDKLKHEAVSEQLLSSRQELALMGEEMARAASARDRTISDLHRSRLQASELEVKLAQLSGRWGETEERWQEERTALQLKWEVEKEGMLRLSAELLWWKASALERESETECLRQELGRERDHNRVQLSEMVRERKEMKSVLTVTQKEKEILQREKQELQEYAKILEQNLEQRAREKERESLPQAEHGTTADPALGARASADRETQQNRAPSEGTRSPPTRQQSDRVVISQPLSIASQLAEAQSEIVDSSSLSGSMSISSQSERPRSPRESVTRSTDPKPAERFEGCLEGMSEVDDSWRECPICKQQFPDGCGQEVLEHHIDSHIFFSTNDPFTFD